MQRQRKNRNTYLAKIDLMFYSEIEIREAVEQARQSENRSGIVQSMGDNNFSDPTANKAVKNMTPLNAVIIKGGQIIKRPESWLVVIDKTYNW